MARQATKSVRRESLHLRPGINNLSGVEDGVLVAFEVLVEEGRAQRGGGGMDASSQQHACLEDLINHKYIATGGIHIAERLSI